MTHPKRHVSNEKRPRMATTAHLYDLNFYIEKSLVQAIQLRFLAQCHNHCVRSPGNVSRNEHDDADHGDDANGDWDCDGGEDDVSVRWLFDANY